MLPLRACASSSCLSTYCAPGTGTEEQGNRCPVPRSVLSRGGKPTDIQRGEFLSLGSTTNPQERQAMERAEGSDQAKDEPVQTTDTEEVTPEKTPAGGGQGKAPPGPGNSAGQRLRGVHELGPQGDRQSGQSWGLSERGKGRWGRCEMAGLCPQEEGRGSHPRATRSHGGLGW